MFLATIVLACMHSLVRYISGELNPLLVVFFRNLFGFILIVPLVYRAGLSELKTSYPKLTLLRSVSGIIAMVTWFYGLAMVPTAEATALSFTAAIFTALAAFIFLQERMRVRRWVAIGFGLVGVLIVLRPTTENFSPYMLLILVSCVFWGLSVTMVKFLTRTDSTLSIVAWMTLLLTLFSLPLAIMHWQLPTLEQLLILMCMGVLGSLGHLGMAKALSLADTTAVMSIDFMRLIWAAIIGSLFFGDGFDIYTWMGALVIFCSGLYIMFRESKAKQAC
ncbi:MAG: drug/metabolite transporter (DMT)-like permease [Saprospiraceae bacterium]|jgi:drug/metabolite transporter (DMT)-like permease